MKLLSVSFLVFVNCINLYANNAEDYISPYDKKSEFQDKLNIGELSPIMVTVPLQRSKYRNCIKETICENSITKIVGSMITRPYAISKYEITFNDYELYVKNKNLAIPEDNGWGRGMRPVIFVAWKQAIGYVDWLSEQSGFEYRLPTVIEWEHAARAGVRTAYWWGSELGVNNANCMECGSKWSQIQTAPVGSFPANPWGIHDMHGNVGEYAQDCAMTNRPIRITRGYTNKFSPDIKMKKNCKWVRLNGGSWLTPEKSSFRREYSSLNPAFPERFRVFRSDYSSTAIGIRVVRIL